MMSSSWSSPTREQGRKEVHQISTDSQKIKKPPLPPKTAARSPVIRYEYQKERIIKVKTPADFAYIVQLLTGDPNRPPPKHPCTCDDDDPQPQARPQGILSPTPTSLPPLFSPDAFTSSPSPPPPPPPPSSDQELCIFDLLEEWAEPAALSSNPIVNSPPPPSPPLPPPPSPNFRVPPSPFRTLNTEIPPSFNTPLPPLSSKIKEVENCKKERFEHDEFTKVLKAKDEEAAKARPPTKTIEVDEEHDSSDFGYIVQQLLTGDGGESISDHPSSSTSSNRREESVPVGSLSPSPFLCRRFLQTLSHRGRCYRRQKKI
ncbi:unnamed protein product [Citrullus colocynthis]|uniref:VQ domain-containing protein n=1 Tax=Citrullus colocynthis TaxID=252529 RepID=A0ABP0XZC1_9ROSI